MGSELDVDICGECSESFSKKKLFVVALEKASGVSEVEPIGRRSDAFKILPKWHRRRVPVKYIRSDMAPELLYGLMEKWRIHYGAALKTVKRYQHNE